MTRRTCGVALFALSLSSVGCALDSDVLDSDVLDSEVVGGDGVVGRDLDEVGSSEAALTPSSCGGSAKGQTHFRAVHFNVLGSTFGSNWASRRSVVLNRMKHVLRNDAVSRAAIYGLTEVTRSEAAWLAQQLGSTYAVVVHNRLQAIVADTSAWSVEDTGKYRFDSGNTAYHGFVHARLKNKTTGRQVNVVETHLSPNAVADAAMKRQNQLSQIKNTVGSWKNPVLVLGDMNWNGDDFDSAAGPGYCSVRNWANTYYPAGARSYGTVGDAYGSGGGVIDHGIVRNGITMRGYRVLRGNFDNVQAGSDHHMLTFHLTI